MEAAAPRVSILIPVYNREAFIGPCIESALAQTFQDFEVVIVDNASADATWAICGGYASRDERVRIFRNDTNIGPVRNWLRCVALARGEFSKLLFSDDLIDAGYLAATLPVLADERVGLAFTAVRSADVDGADARIAFRLPSLRGTQPSGRFLLAALTAGNTPVSPGAAILRTRDLRSAILEEIPSPTLSGFSATGAGVDLLIYLLTAARYPYVAHYLAPLAFFREHRLSISTEKRELVRAQVNQARIWFCRNHMPSGFYRAVLVLTWLVELRRSRSWLPPHELLARYDDTAAPLKSGDFAKALLLLGTLLAHKLVGICFGSELPIRI